MNYRNQKCSHSGLAPQALPQAGNSLLSDPYIYSDFDGERVNYKQVDDAMHRVNRFPLDSESYPGLYNSGLVCTKGQSGIDNQCLCPGSSDSMPFNTQLPEMTDASTRLLFAPFLPGAVPQLTPSAQRLVAERSQLPRGHGSYYELDAPLPCGK